MLNYLDPTEDGTGGRDRSPRNIRQEMLLPTPSRLLKSGMVVAVKRCFLRRDRLQRDFISKILPVDNYVNLKTALHLYSFLTKFCTHS